MSEQEAVKLDFSGLKDVLLEAQKRQIDEIREALKPRDPKGKGVIATGESQGQMLAEAFNSMRETGSFKLAEQWTVAIPNYTAYAVTPALGGTDIPRWGTVPTTNGAMPTSINPAAITETIGGWMCYVLLSNVIT